MAPSLPLAFIAGILSFLSPCVLPLVPSYIAYIGGNSAIDQKKHLVLRNSLFFILGFSIIFITLGASASALGGLLRAYRPYLMTFGGLLIIFFALNMLGLFKLSFLMADNRKQYQGNTATPIGAVLMGMAFAAGWSPCIGPVLGSILTLAGATGTLSQGILLLSFYAIGLGVPFFLAALATERFLKFSSKFKQHLIWVERAAGGLLLVAGLLMVTGYYTVLSRYFLKFTPEWLFSKI